MSWTEEFVDNFNTCLSKVGQNIYDTNEESFPTGWKVLLRTICIKSILARTAFNLLPQSIHEKTGM